ncbi:hypothetical protein [Weissella confusa]
MNNEYTNKKHPALQTISSATYVDVQTKVVDKYGIVQSASDLLLAMHFADMDAVEHDPKEAVDRSASVADSWSQFVLAVEALAKDMGDTVNFDVVPTHNEPSKAGEVVFIDGGTKATYLVDETLTYLIGLVDEAHNWYTFDKVKGLALATDDEIETIQFNAQEFETVNDEAGDTYAVLLSDEGNAIEHKGLLVMHNATGVAY